MTTREVVAALLRRWYLVLAGVAVLAAVLMLEQRASGVYWTEFDVQLVQPAAANVNSLRVSQVDLSSTASLLAVEFNGGKATPGPVDPSLTIVDEGVRKGHAVRAPDYGGQWSRSFRPLVNVQIVDSSRAAVTRQAHAITARLDDLLAQRQDLARVPRQDRIVSTVVPTSPGVRYRTGSHVRAVGGTALAGAAGLGALVVGADAWLLRRRRTRLTPSRTAG